MIVGNKIRNAVVTNPGIDQLPIDRSSWNFPLNYVLWVAIEYWNIGINL